MKLHYSRAAPSQALQLQSSFERLKTLQVVPHASCSQSLHVSLLRDQWRKPVLSPQHDVKQSERKNVCCQASSNALELGTNNGNASEGAQNGIENIQRGNSGLQAVIKAAGIIALFCIWLKISWSRPGSLFGSVAASQPGIKTAGGSAWAGLAAGCLHSLSGPDHLAALTPLTLGRSSVKASLLGAWWGFGHCIGQLILGLLMLLLKDRFHEMLPMLDKYSSLTIGLTLLTIGGLGLYESLGGGGHAHAEPAPVQPSLAFGGAAAAGAVPMEPSPAALLEVDSESSKREKLKGFSLWTLCTGIVYGLQPDALFVVIPALALPTRMAAAAYMTMFVAGTVAAMGGYTAFIGATSSAIKSRGGWFKVEKLSAIASGIAVVMGLTIAFGGNIGLPFLSHAH